MKKHNKTKIQIQNQQQNRPLLINHKHHKRRTFKTKKKQNQTISIN
jgi:hypothetical protein